MSQIPNWMTEAQAATIPVRYGSEAAFATDIAQHVGIDAEAAIDALPVARSLDWNPDAEAAFATKWCDVDDWTALDFDAAAAYLNERFNGTLPEKAVAVATAATSLHGITVEVDVIDALTHLKHAPRSHEEKGHDGQETTTDLWVSVKRNDRSKRRHGSRKGWGDDETILLSWAPANDGEVRVAFESKDREVTGHSVVRGE